MALLILLLAAGILCAGSLPALPSPLVLTILLPLCLLSLRWSLWRWPLAFALGFSWGILYGHQQLAFALPAELVGRDVLVTGHIVDLPQSNARRERFTFTVEAMTSGDGDALPLEHYPRRLLLSWYGGEPVVTGEQWQLIVRLRRPRGFVNPGGFDYQAWLLRQRIDAVGYVRPGNGSRHLSPPPALNVGHWRFQLREWLLDGANHPERGILLALLVGDRSLIAPERWALFQRTGTNHLIAISGLHVGFVALLGFLIGLMAGRLINLLWHRCPALVPAYLCAIACAMLYSALAGFSLPTQRAMTMVLVVQLAFLLRRSYRTLDVFLVALLLVLLIDPLAGYDMGFWLSFGAVAVLLFGFAGRFAPARRWPGHQLLRAQWLIFVGLLIPLALLLHSSALIAPVANIVAIPLVTFLLVPPLLLAAVLQGISPTLSQALLTVAEWGLEALMIWLESLAASGYGLTPVVGFSGWSLLLAALCVALILLPKGLPGRWLGYPGLILALVLPARIPPDLQVTYLEVGQGLAVVVQSGDRTLVFDTGPAFGERFDAGSGIVAPYLRRGGIRKLDKLVISHRHNDHAGGLQGVLAALPVDRVLLGEPSHHTGVAPPNAENCHGFPAWEWQTVNFRFLHWPIASNASSNNHSCVLLIEYQEHSVLLTGDIERAAERQLLRHDLLPERVTILQAPHHGSRSSSTEDFVARVQPGFVVYSAGFGSRHGHPHQEVVDRYAAIGSESFNTAMNGAVEFIWREGKPLEVRAWRQYRKRYWFDD